MEKEIINLRIQDMRICGRGKMKLLFESSEEEKLLFYIKTNKEYLNKCLFIL